VFKGRFLCAFSRGFDSGGFLGGRGFGGSLLRRCAFSSGGLLGRSGGLLDGGFRGSGGFGCSCGMSGGRGGVRGGRGGWIAAAVTVRVWNSIRSRFNFQNIFFA